MDVPARSNSSKVPAATNTLRILSLLTSIDVPISASRIQNELQLPRSTVYHLLTVMEEAGFVIHLPDERTYGLGVAAYAMATSYTTQQPLVRVGARHARKLASAINGSVHLSRLSGSEVLYILEERAPQAVSLITDVGVRLPATQTASGMSMLAYLTRQQIKAAHGSGRDFAQLIDALAVVKLRGWGEEDGKVTRGQKSIAAPIFDHLGQPAAALAVTFPSGSLNLSRQTELTREIQTRAGSIAGTVYGSKAGSYLQNLVSQTAQP